jgi:DNA topoisomerase-3
MNATRLYTLKYREERQQVLSIGRVQTPTLALIVSRQHEIENFVPRQSWVLTTTYRDTKFTAITIDEEAEAEAAAEAAQTSAKGAKPRGPVYRQKEYETEAEGRDVLAAITGQPFTIDSIQKKKGTESPPRLYDLTSLQVECNKKFGFSADQTLQLIQSLYEKKFTTYPRVDTTYLSDDIYPKCPAILKGIRGYEQYTAPLEGKTLAKSKKVFDSSKVTDHHAIIPTGVPAQGLTDFERHVYDLVARAFIAVFYPDCKFETTTVLGSVRPADTIDDTSASTNAALAAAALTPDDVPTSTHVTPILFRTSGRVVTEEGWKVLYKDTAAAHVDGGMTPGQQPASEPSADDAGRATLPSFAKGESGPHTPSLTEKWTQPPKPYTEATLLRAMETAGRFVDNDELRDAMKENGIGRPSTRAAIIETLFKRRYIRKERKNLIATPTGVALIGLIHEELLKSAELTGLWEKKLRDIEHHKYPASQFINELKQMVTDIVVSVRNDRSQRRVAFTSESDLKKKTPRKQSAPKAQPPKSDTPKPVAPVVPAAPVVPTAPVVPAPPAVSSVSSVPATPAGFRPRAVRPGTEPFNTDQWVGMPCPECKTGHIIKGKTAYGCSRWKDGCPWRMPFESKGDN